MQTALAEHHLSGCLSFPAAVSCIVCDPDDALTGSQCLNEPVAEEIIIAFDELGYVRTDCLYCLAQGVTDTSSM